MNTHAGKRRIASRVMGIAAVVIGMGSGLAWLLAPLVSPPQLDAATPSPEYAVDSSVPMILAAFALAGIGFTLLRWSKRR